MHCESPDRALRLADIEGNTVPWINQSIDCVSAESGLAYSTPLWESVSCWASSPILRFSPVVKPQKLLDRSLDSSPLSANLDNAFSHTEQSVVPNGQNLAFVRDGVIGVENASPHRHASIYQTGRRMSSEGVRIV